MNEHELSALLSDALRLCGGSGGSFSLGMATASLNGLDISLDHDTKLGRLILWCGLLELPSTVDSGMWEALLEANLLGARTGGGHIGLYGPTRTLVFSLELDTDGLDAPRLASAFQRFTEKASELIEESEALNAKQSRFDTPFMSNVIWG